MSNSGASRPTDGTLVGVLGVSTGAGVLTFALFPLALPIVVLTVVALLPLAAIALVVGAATALIVAPIRLIARIRQRGRGRRTQRSMATRAVPGRAPASGNSISSLPRPSARMTLRRSP